VPTATEPAPPEREEALSAAASAAGQGVIRCVFDELLPEDARLPFSRAIRDGAAVEAAVDEAFGIASVLPATPPMDQMLSDPVAWREAMKASIVPIATVEWQGAWSGETGTCRVVAPEQVTLRGRIVDEQGHPAPEAWVNGCAADTTWPDAQGYFEMVVWRGTPCVLSVRSSGLPGVGLEVAIDHNVDGIELVDREVDPAEAMQAAADELARQQEMVHPLEAALEDPDLSAEARELLEGWLADEQERTAEQQRHEEESAEFFRVSGEDAE